MVVYTSVNLTSRTLLFKYDGDYGLLLSLYSDLYEIEKDGRLRNPGL